MSIDCDDINYMQAALAMARRGLGSVMPNPSVGCIIVKKGIIIGRGRTAEGGRPHAEAAALEQAGACAKGAIAYVTLEPCAKPGREGPCAAALINAGIGRVVIACVDPYADVNGEGIKILERAGIEITRGVLEKEALELNHGFMLRVTQKRPMITLKIATSHNGKITDTASKIQWITSELARRHVHLERSKYDAILVGINTVLQDNPYLTTRLEGFTHRSIRIVLDRNLKIPMNSNLVATAHETPLWIFHNNQQAVNKTALEARGVQLFDIDPDDLKLVVQTLADEGVTGLLVEGGAKIHGSFVEAGLGDQLLWYRTPRNIDQGFEAFNGLKIDQILAKLGLKHKENRLLGQDLLEIYGASA